MKQHTLESALIEAYKEDSKWRYIAVDVDGETWVYSMKPSFTPLMRDHSNGNWGGDYGNSSSQIDKVTYNGKPEDSLRCIDDLLPEKPEFKEGDLVTLNMGDNPRVYLFTDKNNMHHFVCPSDTDLYSKGLQYGSYLNKGSITPYKQPDTAEQMAEKIREIMDNTPRYADVFSKIEEIVGGGES